jgi:predicted short-subunit dehydrogenase-like oxidoreductase (DUF2520 family)
MRSFSIVGAGRLGTALGAALAKRGWKVEAIVDREARAARESRRLIGAGRASTSPAAAAGARGLVVIAVPDDAIADAARELSRAGGFWQGRGVFHMSGLVTAAALGPLASRGALVASLHPVQTFPRKDTPPRVFRGITWGLEGSPEAVEAATGIVRALGGHVLLLAEKEKALYHAACVLASNALVALEGTAAKLLERAGVGQDQALRTLLPLMQGTLQSVKTLGIKRALTGPLLRGDIGTIRRHLSALRAEPEAGKVYGILARQALDLARSGRGLPAGKIRALKRLLEGR